MMTDKLEQDLAAFFDAAKQETPIPSATLMDAIARDALAQSHMQKLQSTKPRMLWGKTILHSFGGWKPICALATCASFGAVVGYIAPDRLPGLSGTQTQTVDTLTEDSFSVAFDIETLFQEG